jgi:hypothetical protein
MFFSNGEFRSSNSIQVSANKIWWESEVVKDSQSADEVLNFGLGYDIKKNSMIGADYVWPDNVCKMNYF